MISSRTNHALLAFFYGVTAPVDEGRAADKISLDLSKAFHTVQCGILVTKLEKNEFDRWTTHWIRN